MAIFAYDIAISEDLAKRNAGPGFLIHDSGMFADVDERQTAIALEVAYSSAKAFGYQHIITMNSDNVPVEDFEDIEFFEDSIVLYLRDGDDSGRLLGQRI
ncbi:hypothetical protein CCYS_14205 [Corynebacterium cystitidis DSM 20524]|uniref:DUF2326 domain-containing protein n=2 Tax=Corynebacterium cystitidis TaxID=35757 RepID=A0A1H9UTM8_9CORY|nr:hypothetical protein CCYS_14205 [Corynebacterium cystitidis DSM 20524]SES12691.1 hypothetical protein SAMN05661109_01918 [Corynebacterium cystitidis DSM 20524]SNV91147.1 Uncharacterized protein conserved in bacteria (DUF2326) [Corynebacterium cystitidis]